MPEEEGIRLLLLPLEGGPALIPTAVVAEVTAYVAPEGAEDAPPWLLGHVHWRAQRVPLVSLERALGRGNGARRRPARQRNMVVLHSVTGAPRLPYYGVLTLGPPHPRVAGVTDLRATGDGAGPYGWGGVRLKDEERAEIPDLDRLERDLAAMET